MQVTISLDHADLDNLGITIEQFEQAAGAALSNLSHPESAAPIYFNDVRVTVVADCPEIHVDAADLSRCGDLLAQHTVTFAPTRAGMGIGPILPHVLDLADKPKR